MKKWIFKALVQKCISWMPHSHTINHWFQQHVTKGVRLTPAYLTDRLIHAQQHWNFWLRYGTTNSPNVFELGTGWYPIVPMCMFLSGANKIISIDIEIHTTPQSIKDTAIMLLQYYEAQLLQKYLPQIQPERLEVLQKFVKNQDTDANTLQKTTNIHLLASDACHTGLTKNSIHLITSNNTFEHISPEILEQILTEFKRIAAQKAVMSHFIDMSDHFAHFDQRIGIYNFLQFSAKKWRLIDNKIQPQNRLRITDYRNMYKRLNIEIHQELNREGNEDELNKIRLHKEFSHIPTNEILISHSYMVSVIS